MPAAAFNCPAKLIPAPFVIEVTAEELGVLVVDLRGPRTSQSVVVARCIAALLLTDYTLLSQVEIGVALGRSPANKAAGHQIVCSALNRKGDDQRFAQLLEQVRERLLQGNHHV